MWLDRNYLERCNIPGRKRDHKFPQSTKRPWRDPGAGVRLHMSGHMMPPGYKMGCHWPQCWMSGGCQSWLQISGHIRVSLHLVPISPGILSIRSLVTPDTVEPPSFGVSLVKGHNSCLWLAYKPPLVTPDNQEPGRDVSDLFGQYRLVGFIWGSGTVSNSFQQKLGFIVSIQTIFVESRQDQRLSHDYTHTQSQRPAPVVKSP